MRIRDQKGVIESPLVSISCITFNQESYIINCLEGFLNQKVTFPVEILIHDDASCDNTQKIIQSYVDKYPDIIKPIFQSENQFMKGARCIHAIFNFNRSKGKYIATCEGDDYWISDTKLSKQIAFLEKNFDFTLSSHACFRGYWNEKQSLNSALAIIYRNYELSGFKGLSLIFKRWRIDRNSFWLSRRERVKGEIKSELSLTDVINMYNGGGIYIPTASIVGRGDLLRIMPEEIFYSPTGHREHLFWLASHGKLSFWKEVLGQKINQKNSMTQTKIIKKINDSRNGGKIPLKDYLSKFINLDIPANSRKIFLELINR